MTDQQFETLIHTLKDVITATRTYTLTGANDWPILAIMAGAITCLMVYIWQDLKSTIKDNRLEWKTELNTEKTEREKQDDYIWAAIRDCKDHCCEPPLRDVSHNRRPGDRERGRLSDD